MGPGDGGRGSSARKTTSRPSSATSPPPRYELGFPQEHFGSTAGWAETVKTEAAELYHAIAAVIAEWVQAFQLKAAGAAGA